MTTSSPTPFVTPVNTGGGAAVSGGVNTGGGAFIGRDQTITYVGYTVEQVSTLIGDLQRKDQPKVWDGRPPYVGLEPFQEQDAPLFFGREKLVSQLAHQLRGSRFLCIAGPSGSGKSSLMRAGLMAALRHGALPGSDKWLMDICTPLSNPMTQLANAMSAIALRAGLPASASDVLRTTPSPPVSHFRGSGGELGGDELSDLAAILARGGPGQRVVLFIDQFEETFTQTKDEDERRAFLTQIVAASRREGGRVTIVIGMRSDFIGQCATYPDLRASLSGGFQLVGAMEPEELTRAIALPALEVGVHIEPELVAKMIADMKGEPGALPLMQFALRDQFDSEPHKPGDEIHLKLAEYLERGGIEKALNRHADNALNTLDDAGKGIARAVFSSLIDIDNKGTVARRNATYVELTPAGVDEREVGDVVHRLSAARLLTADAPVDGGPRTVTLAHEKLIDSWQWLQRLVNDDRASIALQNEINEDAAEWDANQRDASYLYTGARLHTAQEKVRDNKLTLSAFAKAFVDSGDAEQRRQAQEKETARQLELQQARELAEQKTQLADAQRKRADDQERARKRILIAMAGLAVFFVAAVGAAGFAYRQSRIVQAEQLAAQAVRSTLADPDTTLLLAKEAFDNPFASSFGVREGMLFASQCCAKQLTGFLRGHDDRVWSVAFNHDRDKPVLASGSDDGTLIVWDVNARRQLTRTLSPLRAGLYGVSFNKDDTLLAAGSASGPILLWDVRTWQAVSLTAHAGNVHNVAFSSDGRLLASGSADGSVIVWDVAARTPITKQVQTNRWVWDVAFSPDGRTVASAVQDGSLRLWDVRPTPDVITASIAITNIGNAVAAAFSPDGQLLVTGHTGGRVRLWDMSVWNNRRERPVQLWTAAIHDDTVWGVAFDDEGRLATASEAGRVHLWRVDQSGPDPSKATLRALSPYLDAHVRGIFGIAFDPSGDRMALASIDSLVSLWDTSTAATAGDTFIGHSEPILDIALSADGHTLHSISKDGSIIAWDVAGHKPLTTITLTQPISRAVFSPNGNVVATDSANNIVLLWRASDSTLLGALNGHGTTINSLAFSADGTRLASADVKGYVIAWNVSTQQPIGSPVAAFAGKSRVTSLALNRDGTRLAVGGCGALIRAEASSCGRGEFRLYRLSAEAIEADGSTLPGKSGYVTSLAFSSDDGQLAVGSDDNKIVVWDLKGRTEWRTLSGHTGPVNALAFAPDGRALASGGDDAHVLLWSLEIGREFGRPFNQHKGPVTALAFNADGSALFTAGRDSGFTVDRTILKHDLLYANMRDRACRIANRNFSLEEWPLYFGNEPYHKTCPELP